MRVQLTKQLKGYTAAVEGGVYVDDSRGEATIRVSCGDDFVIFNKHSWQVIQSSDPCIGFAKMRSALMAYLAERLKVAEGGTENVRNVKIAVIIGDCEVDRLPFSVEELEDHCEVGKEIANIVAMHLATQEEGDDE